MKNHYLICFLMTTLLYLNFAEKSYAQKHKTNMMIFSEVAGADEIVAGNYSKAIEQMQLLRSSNPMLLFNNLCVAYALSKQYVEARNHCTKAIKETYRNKNYGTTWLEQTRPHRIKRLYRERAQRHLQILDFIESANTSAASLNAK